MKKRIVPVLLVFLILLNCSSVQVLGREIPSPDNLSSGDDETELTVITPETPGDGEGNLVLSAIIMQGNTDSASDCVAFENTLEASQNGYDYIVRYGWLEGNNTPKTVRVSPSEFATMKNYKVAYYSGHGACESGVPVLNADSPNSFGTREKIYVANLLGVTGSNWASSCTIDDDDPLRVLILAACEQLSDDNSKYYARIMKASSLRIVAGYYGTGPGTGKDNVIAENFVNGCTSSTIRASWQNANSGEEWALLAFYSNNLQNYRLPGFPNATDPAPSSTAVIYRYKNGVMGGIDPTSTSVEGNVLCSQIGDLPLTITVADASETRTVHSYTRDSVWSDISVADDDRAIREVLCSELGTHLADKILVQYNVTREEVDTETGIVPETAVIVERTYRYHDTYNGIKIADSFVSGSVDSKGINNISVQRKFVMDASSNNVGAVSSISSSTPTANVITESDALKLIILDEPGIINAELYDIALAYAPDENGNHVLCYEFMFSHGFRYVNVLTGEIVRF